jgi:hypothetical protein
MESSRIAGEVLGAGVAWQPDLEPPLGADVEIGARPPAPIDTAADDAELGRSLDELAGPT